MFSQDTRRLFFDVINVFQQYHDNQVNDCNDNGYQFKVIHYAALPF